MDVQKIVGVRLALILGFHLLTGYFLIRIASGLFSLSLPASRHFDLKVRYRPFAPTTSRTITNDEWNLVHDAGMSEDNPVTEDANQIAALKAEIEDLKDGIRELIDVVESLSKERRRGELASDETTSLDNSWIRIASLRKRFQPKEAD